MGRERNGATRLPSKEPTGTGKGYKESYPVTKFHILVSSKMNCFTERAL